jgi:hypothetical protein
MSAIHRRHFLQLAGSTLATLGLNQADFLKLGDRHNRVLAQPTGRKLALLVGINQYPSNISSLRGCLMDVQMQYELLVHRYGFNPKDILILSDNAAQKPTRQNLLTAFEEHLIKQAKPGDSVVFHYSGHGSTVIDPNPIKEFGGRNGTLVVSDARSNIKGNEVNDIMGATLFLLTRAIKTDNVSMILDSCHSGGGVRGNSRIRAIESRTGTNGERPSALERTYQDNLRQQLKLSPEELKTLRQKGIANGMALGSAQISQAAADSSFNGFSAGAFTYLLTRYLWQDSLPSSIEDSFSRLALMTRDTASSSNVIQDPIYSVEPGQNYEKNPIYFTKTTRPAAEAVIQEVTGKQVKFWLGGISAKSLDGFTQGAIFEMIDDQEKIIGEIEQTGRVGLVGDGILKSGAAKPGTLLREKVRGIPTDLKLRIGLDASLGKDLSNAQIALKDVRRIETVSGNQRGSNTPVDFVLGRLTPPAIAQAKSRGDIPPAVTGSIGLLTSGLVPVPDSFGLSTQESVEGAIARLQPRLKMLLAGRLLGTMLNSDSSDLKVNVEIRPTTGGKVISLQSSRGGESKTLTPQSIGKGLSPVKPNTQIEVSVTNQESMNLYLGVIVISNSGDLTVLHPIDWNSPEASAIIPAGKTLVVPEKTGNTKDDFQFYVQGPRGFFELLVITSTEPLRDSLKAMQTIAKSRGTQSGNPLGFDQSSRGANESDEASVGAIDALLGDLDRGTRSAGIVPRKGTRGLSSKGLAAFSTVIQVTD